MHQSQLHFLGVAGIRKKRKKPVRVIETDPEETIDTNSSGDCSPKKTQNQVIVQDDYIIKTRSQCDDVKTETSNTLPKQQTRQTTLVSTSTESLIKFEEEEEKSERRNHLHQNKSEQVREVGTEEELKSLPWFVKDKFLQDRNKVRPGEPLYDNSTLYIPADEFGRLSPVMQQYWYFKSQHYDKIVCFKLGKFYEIFYEDAILCHKFLDLNWMGAKSKLHVGFPEVSLAKYAKVLVDNSFKVCIVDQVEDEDDDFEFVEEPPASKPTKKSKKMKKVAQTFMGRQVTAILTRGLFNVEKAHCTSDLLSYESQWVLAIKALQKGGDDKIELGVVLFDMQSMQIRIGQFTDDSQTLTHLRTLLSHERPVQVTYDRAGMPKSVLQCLRQALQESLAQSVESGRLVSVPSTQEFNMLKGVATLKKYIADQAQLPPVLKQMRCDQYSWLMAWATFGLLIFYLERNLLAHQVITVCDYSLYDPKKNDTTFGGCSSGAKMQLDAQAVRHLQLLEAQKGIETTTEGSLFHLIDNTKTLFGKRLLRRWICQPLMLIESIETRQAALEDLMRVPETVRSFQSHMEGLPDLERLIATVYQQSVSTGAGRTLSQNIPLARLKEFYAIIDKLKETKQSLAIFTHVREEFKCDYLRRMVTFDTEKLSDTGTMGSFPDIDSAISEFEALVSWQQISQWDRVPEPVKGFDSTYDNAKLQAELVQKALNQYLTQVRSMLGFSRNRDIKYVHCKYPYEIEVPNEQIKDSKRPPDFELSSHRSGHSRFITPLLKQLTEKMEKAKKQSKRALVPFVCSMFQRFHAKRQTWQKIVSYLAELDCLCSLVIFATTTQGGAMCKPKFLATQGRPFLELKQMRHPGVTLTFKPGEAVSQVHDSSCQGQTMQGTSSAGFIANDTILGVSDNPHILLLTGPNMGGKSTLLRQVCLAVILAQMGSFVPAESFILTPVDKVFTRLGAEDNILHGKSTFWVEMEETKTVLDQATEHSLVIMDELGRGTSTFDGQAIAEAVLNHLAKKMRCRALFSTHYHALQGKYAQPVWQSKVAIARMDYRVDHERNRLVYLYKLRPGACPSSFGINIARIAGLPDTVVSKAAAKSEEFKQRNSHLYLNFDSSETILVEQGTSVVNDHQQATTVTSIF